MLVPAVAILADLARQGVRLGTSSWKYQEWDGIVYTLWAYCRKGRKGEFSAALFERACLSAYAEIFPTVCADYSFYAFPGASTLFEIHQRAPAGFLMAFKVTEAITVKTFSSHPRYGARAGAANPDFLNAERFVTEFLTPLEAVRRLAGPLIFQFPSFKKSDFAHGRDFVSALDAFLSQLPAGWRYCVELRNKTFLHPDYFACLRRHGVAHCFNSWERMPSVAVQMQMPGAMTADFTVARFLTTPGRSYAASEKAFKPYSTIREVDEPSRVAMRALIEAGKKLPGGAFIYVNNRLEGCAPLTIAAVVEGLKRGQ